MKTTTVRCAAKSVPNAICVPSSAVTRSAAAAASCALVGSAHSEVVVLVVLGLVVLGLVVLGRLAAMLLKGEEGGVGAVGCAALDEAVEVRGSDAGAEAEVEAVALI